MTKPNPLRFALLAAVCLWIYWDPGRASADPVRIVVSILPQKTFVEKVGGSLVDVSVMVPPGANPHSYEPKPAQMASISKAKIYFAIGIGFEDPWLDKFSASNTGMRIIHTEEGIQKIPMAAHLHEEGNENSHREEHGVLDPHVWLSPPNVKIIAENIRKGLTEIDPAHAATYNENSNAFLREIDQLHAELKAIFADKKGVKFMVFHPAWGYFANAYGLIQVPVEIEGKEPKPAQLMQLVSQARKDGIKVIFVQPQFSTRSAETIAKSIGGEVAVADDLRPDWAENLREQAARFKAALR